MLEKQRLKSESIRTDPKWHYMSIAKSPHILEGLLVPISPCSVGNSLSVPARENQHFSTLLTRIRQGAPEYLWLSKNHFLMRWLHFVLHRHKIFKDGLVFSFPQPTLATYLPLLGWPRTNL